MLAAIMKKVEAEEEIDNMFTIREDEDDDVESSGFPTPGQSKSKA